MATENESLPIGFVEDETTGKELATKIIRVRSRQEWASLVLPYFIFLLNAGAVTATMIFPDFWRVVESGIFFVFSFFFLHRAKSIYKT